MLISGASTGGGPASGRPGSRDVMLAAPRLALAGEHGRKGQGSQGCRGAASPRAAPCRQGERAKEDKEGSTFPPCSKTPSLGLLSPSWPCGGDAPGSGAGSTLHPGVLAGQRREHRWGLQSLF